MARRLYLPLDVAYFEDATVSALNERTQLADLRLMLRIKRVESDGSLTVRQANDALHGLRFADRRLAELVSSGLWYETPDGIARRNWLKWHRTSSDLQELRETRSEMGRRGGLARASKAKQIASQVPSKLLESSEANCLNEDQAKASSLIKEREKNIQFASFASDFEAWYAAYPRKVGRPKALQAYQRAVKAGTTPAAIAEGLERWARYWRADHTEPQFIPHPTTWLNQSRWRDDPPAVADDGWADAWTPKVTYS